MQGTCGLPGQLNQHSRCTGARTMQVLLVSTVPTLEGPSPGKCSLHTARLPIWAPLALPDPFPWLHLIPSLSCCCPHAAGTSCDGGTLAMVLVRRRGGLLPAVGLFAARDIAAGEELTFCYGGGGDAGEAGAAGVGQAGGNSNTPRAAVDGDETPGIGNRPVAGRESAEMGGAGSAGVCEGGAGGGSGAVARASPRSGNGEHASRAGGGGVGVRRRVVCLCGTPACRGYLPAEDV